MLIDTHAHLYWDSFKQSLPPNGGTSDFDEVIKRSLEADVTTIINVGVDVKLSKLAADLESTKIKFYSTIGIHPHEAIKYKGNDVSIHEDISRLEEIKRANISKVVGVGECGLDYYFDPKFNSSLPINQQKNLQKKLFQAQIDLAKKLDLPLIVHCRDDRSKNPTNSEAWDETLGMIGNYPTILHCYSGLLKTTEKVMQMPNTLVSFAATLTYPKNEYLREIAQILPLEKIVLETDCPFLPPQSKRGQKNEPATVLEIAQLIADLKKVSLEEVANKTTANVKKILRINSGLRL